MLLQILLCLTASSVPAGRPAPMAWIQIGPQALIAVRSAAKRDPIGCSPQVPCAGDICHVEREAFLSAAHPPAAKGTGRGECNEMGDFSFTEPGVSDASDIACGPPAFLLAGRPVTDDDAIPRKEVIHGLYC